MNDKPFENFLNLTSVFGTGEMGTDGGFFEGWVLFFAKVMQRFLAVLEMRLQIADLKISDFRLEDCGFSWCSKWDYKLQIAD